jgi:hypothetical protein
MDHRPPAHEVHSFIEDYARDFGIAMPYEDAERVLVLYEEICSLFEQYSEGNDDHPLPPFLLG